MVDKSLTSTNFTQILHPFRSYTQSCAQSRTQKKQPAKADCLTFKISK